jgi:hypothetical protein
MIKREMDALNIRKVGGNIVGRDGNLAILHIFGVDKLDVINNPYFFKQNRTDKSIKITARH